MVTTRSGRKSISNADRSAAVVKRAKVVKLKKEVKKNKVETKSTPRRRFVSKHSDKEVDENRAVENQRDGAVRRSRRLIGTTVTKLIERVVTRNKDKKSKRKSGSSKVAAKGSAAKKSAATAGLGKGKEISIWKRGFKHIAGVDEAGRGPLAGCVTAAACIIPEHVKFDGVDDSKKLSEETRVRLFQEITSHPDVQYAICCIDEVKIDEINILQASMLAMRTAVGDLKTKPDYVLVDGPYSPGIADIECEPVVKGDSKVYAIACASILAKVHRDRLMDEYHEKYPQYGFGKNKGYPTMQHRNALIEHGPCPIHRKTFGPVKTAIEARTKKKKK